MKKTKEQPAKIDPFVTWPKRDFGEGDKVIFKAEVNGNVAGTRAEVLRVAHEGAIFLVRVITGPQNGAEFRIAARDLV